LVKVMGRRPMTTLASSNNYFNVVIASVVTKTVAFFIVIVILLTLRYAYGLDQLNITENGSRIKSFCN
jgi:hypothetical protein